MAANEPEPPASSVRIARVLPVAARVPLHAQPDRTVIATIPFVALPVVPWSRSTTGDKIVDLIGLVQRHGGRWISRNTTSTLDRWVPGPSHSGKNHDLRLDVTIDGVWSGRFAVTASADDLAVHLDSLARSPIVAFLPNEIVERIAPMIATNVAFSWLQLGRILDDVVHIADQPIVAPADRS